MPPNEIYTGPQIPLESVYERILAFFLRIDPAVLARELAPYLYAWKFIGTFLSLLFFVGIIAVSRKMREFQRKQAEADGEDPQKGFFETLFPSPKKREDAASAVTAGSGAVTGAGAAGGVSAKEADQTKAIHKQKWQRVADHVESANPNDWRLSILEADILLEELLDMIGAHGETLGEKLKSMSPAEMPSLQMAWEAHRVRNQIAHEGADFQLSQREARRIIQLYESVLRSGLYL